MQSIKWSKESNGVAVPAIDEEHQRLFELAEEIDKALSEGVMLNSVEEPLRRLIDEAGHHFSHEEKLMKAGRYPAYTWHKGQHDTVRRKIAELDRAAQQQDREAAVQSLDFITAWLKTHTAVSDRMMGAYFRTKPARNPR